MKAATVVQIKKELQHRNPEELLELCLRLSKFKKENKELLTYLLFEADNEQGYIQTVKSEVDELFSEINTNSYFYFKKSVRKILRNLKKYIRYSGNKETEVELLLYFCQKLKDFHPSIERIIAGRFKGQLGNLLVKEYVSSYKDHQTIHLWNPIREQPVLPD